MKIDWKHLWAEAIVVAGAIYAFLTPSLAAYVAQHPSGTLSTVLGLLIAMGLKKSAISKG